MVNEEPVPDVGGQDVAVGEQFPFPEEAWRRVERGRFVEDRPSAQVSEMHEDAPDCTGLVPER